MKVLLYFLATQAEALAETYSAKTFGQMFLRACFAEPAEAISLPPLEADAPLSAALRARFGEALPLTPGAARLVRSKENLFAALEVILSDRLFRKELRRLADQESKTAAARRMLSLGRSLTAPRPQSKTPQTPLVLPRLGGLPKLVSAASRVKEPLLAGTPPFPPGLERFRTLPVSTSSRAKEGTLRIGDLVNELSGTQASLPALAQAMRSLAGSTNRVAIILLQRAVARGEIGVRADAMPYLVAEAARALVTLNANSSAFALSATLLEQYRRGELAGLAAVDVHRVLVMHARICLRTGQSEDARRIYKQLRYANPADPVFAMEYFHSVFADHPLDASAAGRAILLGNLDVDYGGCMALAEFFIANDAEAEAVAFLIRAGRQAANHYEHLLTGANLALRRGDEALWLTMIQEFGSRSGMPLLVYNPAENNRVFAFQGGGAPDVKLTDMVSVMMTAFNSITTISAAIRSVLAQRGVDVELIVIDDGSTDGTREELTRLSAQDPRLRVVMNTRNMGTYASKNHGISIARGTLLAFHDSDDWMHPMHLRHQAQALTSGHVCTTSKWLRMRADGYVIQRRGGGYSHLNPASTMFRREVVEEIGPFDFVRTGADAEYLTRIRMRYGWESVVAMEDCLALGLHHEGSLTQSGATAFDEHRYSPVRLAYTEAWIAHHLETLEGQAMLRLNTETERPFDVPVEIRS